MRCFGEFILLPASPGPILELRLEYALRRRKNAMAALLVWHGARSESFAAFEDKMQRDAIERNMQAIGIQQWRMKMM